MDVAQEYVDYFKKGVEESDPQVLGILVAIVVGVLTLCEYLLRVNFTTKHAQLSACSVGNSVKKVIGPQALNLKS